jgi:hypothetical protein
MILQAPIVIAARVVLAALLALRESQAGARADGIHCRVQ